HVVFAVAFEFDVAQDDHLVVAGNFLEGALQVRTRVFGVAAEPVAIGLDDALRGAEQAFARRILAGPAKQGADRRFGVVTVDAIALLVGVGHGAAPWKVSRQWYRAGPKATRARGRRQHRTIPLPSPERRHATSSRPYAPRP